MFTLLDSSPNLGAVTANVKIWNREESFLTTLCAFRYWFACNIERACQSYWGCVGCMSGPMGMYRTYDLDCVLGPWLLQSYGGRETTFGDDRHLTNQILSRGLNTRYTHRTSCQTESPSDFVRWIKQQTRWARSFFREAFWFPRTLAHQSPWYTFEITKQVILSFTLIGTIIHFLYWPTSRSRPFVCFVTMLAISFLKSLCAVAIEKDWSMLLYTFYSIHYVLGILPSVRSL